MTTKISDLLDVIHYTIIKNVGDNGIVLQELQAIDEKLKTGQLTDYVVDVPFFMSIVASESKNIQIVL